MDSVPQRLEQVQARIAAAASSADRDPTSIRLVAVSKRQPASAVRIAYAAGVRDFGENYVQELTGKAKELADLPDLRWHFIGHLQRNKAKVVLQAASVIHTLDSPDLVQELAKRAPDFPVQVARRLSFGGRPGDGRPAVLVEVNVGGEAQKSGCNPEQLPRVLEAIETCPSLHVVGLMTVPPFTEEAEDSRAYFEQLAALREKHGGATRLPELSMGMTLDLEYAIAAGATLVRVGTAIFGERPLREVLP